MAGSKGSKYYNVFLNYQLNLVDIDENEVLDQEGIDLLLMIREKGSIVAASKELGISYRKAWGIISVVEEKLGFPLVAKQRGGAAGGMTTLTSEGDDLAKGYDQLRKQFDRSIKEITRKFFRKINKDQ